MREQIFTDRLVNYTMQRDGRLVLVENVPARVCEETGEQFFAPETVEKLQRLIWNQPTPARVIETPVFAFA